MPDWDSKELTKVKQFVLLFTKAMNGKKASQLRRVFHKDAILHREMQNFLGHADIIKWYEKVWDTQGFRQAEFVLMDATAGILPDGSAKCILWFEIKVPSVKLKGAAKPNPKQIHVETLDLKLYGKQWRITKCFGLGYEPKDHKKYFKNV
ncbi:MAG: nuclear transport factor 2 family protein [bacterium]|nr:nuclear transport factor 2 family protein [bacterium]